jgi:thiol-disulfide isomerase/thioredoxin
MKPAKKPWRQLGTYLKYGLYALALVAVAVSVARPNSGPKRGTEAAAFALPLVGQPGEVRLADKAGKPMIIEVFASWCGSCRSAAPTLAEAYQQRKDTDVEFLAVSVDDTEQGALRAQLGWGIPYPVAHDSQGRFAAAYNVKVLPTFVLVDRHGRIHSVSTGAPSRSAVDDWIEGLSAMR